MLGRVLDRRKRLLLLQHVIYYLGDLRIESDHWG